MVGIRAQVVLGLMMAVAGPAIGEDPAPTRLYIGTYTGDGERDSRGIYIVDFDPQQGRLSNPRLAAEATNPTFLTLDRDQTRLFSVAEVRSGQGRSGAALVAWKVGDDGTLTEIGRAPSGGDGPCFVALSPDEKFAAIANYGGGSVALFAVDAAGVPTQTDVVQHTGHSEDSSRQRAPHAHSIQFTRDGQRALAADLGTDELIVYDIDAAKGQLTRNDELTYRLADGQGPWHFAFSPEQKFVLVIGEMSNTITSLRYDGDGPMTKVGDYPTLPADFSGSNTTAEILFHPNGRFVYGSNRGHDSIAVFSFDASSGELAPLAHVPTGGDTPRNFRLSPDGRWMVVANQDSNNLVLFRVGEDGIPQPANSQVAIGKPVCIKFVSPHRK